MTALPHNTEAEQAVLGGMMMAPGTYAQVCALVSEADFYSHEHRSVFKAIYDLRKAGQPIDPVTVNEQLANAGITGISAVDLATGTFSAANITSYAQIVRDLGIKRQLADSLTALTAKALNCAAPGEIIAEGLSSLTLAMKRAHSRAEEPLDLFSDYATQTLRPEWLPPGVAQYAMDQARVIGVAPEMIALSCLVGIAGAISDEFVIPVKANEKGWTERACLWFMLIAEPGEKKSAAVKRGMGPLHKIDQELTAQFAAKLADYIPKEKEFQIRAKDAANRAAKGEGYEEAPRPPERPPHHQAIFKNATNAALSELLVDNARGLTMYSDEIVVWFAGMDPKRDAGESRGYALKAYDGGPEKFNRIGRGNVHVPNWSYSVIGTTQPDKIAAMVARDPDDGLLQRFMVVDVRRGAVFPDYDTPADAHLERQYENNIRTLWNTQPGTSGSVIRMSPEAAAEFEAFSRFVIGASRSGGLPVMLRGHLSKWEGLWPRLVLIYHCWGCAMIGKHPASVEVSTKTTARVTAFMKRFLIPQSMRFYGQTVGNNDPVYGLAQKIASAVLSNGDAAISSREMQRSVNAWRCSSDLHRKGCIQLLKDAAWIIGSESNGNMGQESAWVINPRVHEVFAARAAEEGERRTESARTMRTLREAAEGRREEAGG